MNNDRRKELDRAIAMIEDVRSIIETAQEEEQESFDNFPEGLQQSEKGEAMEAAIDNLEQAFNSLEEVEEYIAEAKG